MATWDTQYTMTGGPVQAVVSRGVPTSQDTSNLVLEGTVVVHITASVPCDPVSIQDPGLTTKSGRKPIQALSLGGPIPEIVGKTHPVLFMGNFAVPIVIWYKMRARDSSRSSDDPYIVWKVQYYPDFSGSECPLPHGTLTELSIADTWQQQLGS